MLTEILSASTPTAKFSGSIQSSCSSTLSKTRTQLTIPSSIRASKRGASSICGSRLFLGVRPSSSPMIENDTPEIQRPHTFIRESDDGESAELGSVRARFEKMIREVQDSVCSAIEAVEGGAKFKEDVWSRPGGGGGISRVLQDGAVWEKAGVNVSVVYGVMPPEAYRSAKPTENGNAKLGPVPFFAAGISSVLHPKNPFAPTLHFNYRYFETDPPKGSKMRL